VAVPLDFNAAAVARRRQSIWKHHPEWWLRFENASGSGIIRQAP
jgi:hypothetical protein